MKWHSIFLILILFTVKVNAQPDSIVPYSLSVGLNKTTSLVFPQIIKSIDRGSRDLLIQKVNGVENVLQVKAARENFDETNMTVITADGKLYSFIVRYGAEPSHLTIQLDSSISVFERIARQKQFMHNRDENYDMILRLKGIYIEKGIMYYQLELEDQSNVSYDIELLRFYIKDNKQSKRTASQELDQVPLYVYGNTVSVPAMSRQTMVVALQKFTIPDKKYFYIQVMEKNGGRHLRLKIRNTKIVRARTLNGI